MVVYEPMAVPYFQTLDIGVEVSVTVNVFPFTPIGIVCVAVGVMLLLAKFIIKLVPLLAPVVVGLLATTRIRYPVPVAVFAGIVAVIVPELATLVTVPIFTGEAKLPALFDN